MEFLRNRLVRNGLPFAGKQHSLSMILFSNYFQRIVSRTRKEKTNDLAFCAIRRNNRISKVQAGFSDTCLDEFSLNTLKFVSTLTTSESISLNGFLCACGANLSIDSIIDVYLVGPSEQLVGKARIARSESKNAEYPRYGCRFVEKIGNWVLQ